MRPFVNFLLGLNPYPELLIRRIFYSNNFFKKLKEIRVKKKNKKVEVIPDLFKKVVNHIKTLGIKKGDILIVHSSMDGLASTGASPKQYIDMLFELVGEEGTLVIPAFPLYKKSITNVDHSGNQDILVYEPKRTICGTGMLPNIFLRYPAVIRSEFPINSLAAKGPCAEEMMRNNLESDLAHGKNSSWGYCIEHYAKVLFLGVKSNRSTTIVHAAEDLMDSEWPIENWYEKKQFVIKRKQDEQLITVRSRRPYWFRFVTSHYRSRVFIKNNLLQESEVDGISVGYIPNSRKLVDFLAMRAIKGNLFFKVPRKYWKK
ncbi:MAG: AAC(3) family N-acetyltransferase [Candidatus Theseobacter exili]|nr:AAC(3) family N-acetyltransferase [Candidatus Theseobacter exili]